MKRVISVLTSIFIVILLSSAQSVWAGAGDWVDMEFPAVGAKDIGVSKAAWAIGKDGHPYKFAVVNGKLTWIKQTGSRFIRIDVGVNGDIPWAINEEHNIYVLSMPSPTGLKWGRIDGKATDIGIGSYHHYHNYRSKYRVIGTNKVSGGLDVYAMVDGKWEKKKGGGLQIDVSNHGDFWVINNKNNIKRYKIGKINNEPETITGKARDIGIGSNYLSPWFESIENSAGVADGTVWVVGTEKISGGYKIYRYKSGLYIKDRWVHVPGAGAVRISVDNLGQAWIINDKGKVFTYKKRPSEDI